MSILGSMLLCLLAVLLSSCASFSPHVPSDSQSSIAATLGWSAERLYHHTCELGNRTTRVEGSVLFKAQSKDVNGQFSANVLASAPSEVKMEVTNLIGGTVALIEVEHGHYTIRKGSNEHVSASGDETWAGIPLRWAGDLFLGKFPCPIDQAQLNFRKTERGQLIIESTNASQGSQKFTYTYIKIEGSPQPWPESLHWERTAASTISVDFKFDRPDQNTMSPLQWEANSNEGIIKVRWKDRNSR